jgi:hypothetical protein
MTLPTSFAGCRSAITCVRIVSPCNAPGLGLARAARVEREGYIRVVDESGEDYMYSSDLFVP